MAKKFARAKDGLSATSLGASFNASAFTPEISKGFYDDGIRVQPYPDNERCVFVRKTRYSQVERRCGHPRLIRDVCFYHCSEDERIQYQAQRDAKKKMNKKGLI